MIYDFKNRKIFFSLEPAHSETIFDLKYNPIDYGIFATCSFDGFVKIWNMKENKIIYNLKQELPPIDEKEKKEKSKDEKQLDTRVHIYSLKWSPIEKNLIASGDNYGSLRIWCVNKQKSLAYIRLNIINEAQLIGIDWDSNNNIVATSLENIYLCSYASNKINLNKIIKSPSVIFQCKFNPFDLSVFAVACVDNTIRLYDNTNEKPISTLTGHNRKVFGLAFNSKRKGILASTSDDFRIGVWDIERNLNFFLTGHTNNTRQVLWLPTFNNILISGSWDGIIRIWNVDTVSCIGQIEQHFSDVYGIDISPHHPFLLTSCSRDNSIRFFNLLLCTKNLVEYIINFENKNLDLAIFTYSFIIFLVS